MQNNHCNCNRYKIIEGDLEVCTNCGVSNRVFLLDTVNISYNQRHSVSNLGQNTYSRRRRFRTMVSQAIRAQSSDSDEKMMKYMLSTEKAKNLPDLLLKIKGSNLKDKRYSSLHYFSRHFVESYKPSTSVSDRTIDQIIHLIMDI